MTRQVIDIVKAVTLDATYSGCDVLASGGFYTITLPAPIANCDIRIVNGDTGSGKIMAGFPADVNPKLYPNQAVAVNSDGNTWFAEEKPGRWKIPSGTIVYVNNGSQYSMGADTNDGLTPSTALLTMNMAGHVCQTDFDTNQTAPIIAPMAGSNFVNDQLALGGQPTGGNLIQLSPYGSGTITWTCTGPCISVGDNSEINLAWNALSSNVAVTLQGNTANTPDNGTIYFHNNGLGDMSGICTIVGSGRNCSAIFFDGPTAGAAISNGFNIQNTFGDIFRMDEGGGRFTLSGGINVTGPTIAARMFGIYGASELILGGPIGSPASAYLSIGPSLVAGDLVTNGLAIPGGVQTISGGRVQATKTS